MLTGLQVLPILRKKQKGNSLLCNNSKIRSAGMKGTFQNTTIIMMGCNGLTYPYMAQAFIGKGVKVYISWDLAVSASHTDKATIHLLQRLITEKQTIKQEHKL